MPTRRRKAAGDAACTVRFTAPKSSGSACTRKVSRVTMPRLPPPPPFRPQNSSGSLQALAMRTAPSAVTTSASSRLPEASPKALEKLPKPPLCTSPATPTVMQPPPWT